MGGGTGKLKEIFTHNYELGTGVDFQLQRLIINLQLWVGALLLLHLQTKELRQHGLTRLIRRAFAKNSDVTKHAVVMLCGC